MIAAAKRRAAKKSRKPKMAIPERTMLQVRSFQNPLATYSQTLHQIQEGKRDAGWIKAPVNLVTIMGGFARFHGNKVQQEAAARFKRLHDQAMLGGGRAMDPAVEYVDGGGINPEGAMVFGADARKEFAEARAFLGKTDCQRAEYVIIGENGPTAYARFRMRGERAINGQVVGRLQVEMRRIMDRLVAHWKLMP